MGQSTPIKFGEAELSAVNARRADALSNRDASAWDEAIDWGTLDCSIWYRFEWQIATTRDFD